MCARAIDDVPKNLINAKQNHIDLDSGLPVIGSKWVHKGEFGLCSTDKVQESGSYLIYVKTKMYDSPLIFGIEDLKNRFLPYTE